MTGEYIDEPMLEMFIYETSQLLEQLEQAILDSEKSGCYTQSSINEIFRIMHTIKGSSAMMLFNNISGLAHSVEDVFFYLREQNPQGINYNMLSDMILRGIDFIKVEIQKIKDENNCDGDPSQLIEEIKEFLSQLKELNPSNNNIKPKDGAQNLQQKYYISHDKKASVKKNIYKATIHFEQGCEMENIRAFAIIHNLKDIADEIYYEPEDIIDNDDSVKIIREQGFKVYLRTDNSFEEMNNFFQKTVFLKDIELIRLENDEELKRFSRPESIVKEELPVKTPVVVMDKYENEQGSKEVQVSAVQSIISVQVNKLDKLLDLVGELVVTEAMVTENPIILSLEEQELHKATGQLKKITSELQRIVMSMRMVPLSATFHKMNRVIRDMSKKLGKEVELEIIGEETEVDKNIIEHISDPLMHLVRNAVDHGIDSAEERLAKGKNKIGKVTLEAKHIGGNVQIIVRDDGKGLNKDKILKKARENGLFIKNDSEMTEKEIYNLIFLPGFSTKENVTEFSGRGVGMDVVTRNIEAVGGSVLVDSRQEEGTSITLKIPLTLAIIDGMNIRVGKSQYTIPTNTIRQSFRPSEKDIIRDPDGNEMIMVRGKCLPILKLHEFYNVIPESFNIHEGIIITVESEDKTLCLFADELIGEHQAVVKALPDYIRNTWKVKGISGCTILGDGSISLILDIAGLINPYKAI